MKEVWISAYLYYSEPWEEFLVKAVKPFAESLINSRKAHDFFFIRYWENGPHIRLRLKVYEQHKADIEREVYDYFSLWFSQNLSNRKEENILWQKNNTVVFETYQPEVNRYGGEAAIPIAEKIFALSSKAILQVIQEEESWDYQKALTSAIYMNLCFAHAAGMDKHECISFFSYISQQWFFSVLGGTRTSEEEYVKNKKAILNAFEQSYKNIQTTFNPFIRDFLADLNGMEDNDDSWLKDWYRGLREMLNELKELFRNGQLVSPDPVPLSKEQSILPLWPIYSSLIHMTNNRLGVLNRDESYMGFLISRSFTDSPPK